MQQNNFETKINLEELTKFLQSYFDISWKNIISALLILIFAYLLLKISNYFFSKTKFQKFNSKIINGIINFIIVILAVILSLESILINPFIKEAVAILLIASIIFSLLPLFRNIIGGMYIIHKKPFSKGDYIQILNFYGEVIEISWRHTSLLNTEGGIFNIPNSLFLTTIFENVNVGQKEQLIALSFAFSFSLPVEKIQTVLYEAAISCPYAYTKKKPTVILEESDYLQKVNKFKLSLYFFDAKFENMLIDYVNKTVFENLKDFDN